MIEAGALINCALFLLLTGLAAIASDNHWAVGCAIGSAGAAVVGYTLHMYDVRWSAMVAGLASNVLAIGGAVVLFVGWAS